MPFVPRDFDVPDEVELAGVRLRLVDERQLAKRYEAQTSSLNHLRQALAYRDQPWLASGMTMPTAFSEICHCQWQHHNRLSFTYGVFDLGDTRQLGGIHIEPTNKAGAQAQTVSWVRASELGGALDETLFDAVRHWVSSTWPFDSIAFPGRLDEWDECRITDFVAPDFVPPDGVAFGSHVLSLLKTEHLLLDFNAYMANIEHIRSLPTYTHDWPSDDISLEFALIDLGMCEWQHNQQRDMFSYGVFDRDLKQELGCLYLTRGELEHDVTVESWMSKQYSDEGMDAQLTQFAVDWLAAKWPFHNPCFSGFESV